MVAKLKRLIRPVVEAGISAVGPHRWPSRHRRLVVLTYHRVLPKSDPEWDIEQPGMLVTPETLEMHLERVRRHFEVVHLDDWVRSASEQGPLPRIACAVTFDDGWQDNYEHAFPVLRSLKVPATIFLVTDRVGTTQSFWPNRFARLMKCWPGRVGDFDLRGETLGLLVRLGLDGECEPAALSRETVDQMIEAAKSNTDEQLAAALDEVEIALGWTGDGRRDLLNWDEVRQMRDSDLVRFGSHTRNHIRLVEGLCDATLTDEIEGSRACLEVQLGKWSGLFCYPNGDCSDAAFRQVRANYQGAVSTRTGWNDERSDRLMLNRIGLHDDVTRTRTSLQARLSGWI